MASMACSVVCGAATTKKVQSNRAVFSKNVSIRTKKQMKNMLVWNPFDNKMFETFSYLPPLTDDQLSKNVDYIVNNGWVPCLEFAAPEQATVSNEFTVRMGAVTPGYYDNRYWTMWKLPMFGCTDASSVFQEIQECSDTFPNAYIRLVAFDNIKQVQILCFLVHRPENDSSYCTLDNRSKGYGA